MSTTEHFERCDRSKNDAKNGVQLFKYLALLEARLVDKLNTNQFRHPTLWNLGTQHHCCYS